MARMEPVPAEDCTDPELAAALGHFTKTLGFVPNSLLTMQRVPAIAVAVIALNRAVFAPDGEVDLGLKRLVAHVASTASGCQYCKAHTTVSATRHGVSDEKMAAIYEYSDQPVVLARPNGWRWTSRWRPPRCPTRSPTRRTPLSPSTGTEAQIVELLGVVCMFGVFNRWNDSMATPLEELPLARARSCWATPAGPPASTTRPEAVSARTPPAPRRRVPRRVELDGRTGQPGASQRLGHHQRHVGAGDRPADAPPSDVSMRPVPASVVSPLGRRIVQTRSVCARAASAAVLASAYAKKRVVLRHTVVRSGAEVGHHHVAADARAGRRLQGSDRRVAVDGVRPLGAAAARAADQTTASCPLSTSAIASTSADSMSKTRPEAPSASTSATWSGLRTTAVTWWPLSWSSGVSRRATLPWAPMMAMRMRGRTPSGERVFRARSVLAGRVGAQPLGPRQHRGEWWDLGVRRPVDVDDGVSVSAYWSVVRQRPELRS